MARLLIIATLIAALTAATMPDIVLTGTAKDCLGRRYVDVAGVDIGAFDPAKNHKMIELLRVMDTAVFNDDDTLAMPRFEAKYMRLVELATTSTALVRTASDSIGKFSLSLPPIDSVLVFGYAETEDVSFYYSYRMIAARANASFYLDMSRGECHYP